MWIKKKYIGIYLNVAYDTYTLSEYTGMYNCIAVGRVNLNIGGKKRYMYVSLFMEEPYNMGQ